MTDLSTVPLVALSTRTRQLISMLLNPPKVIPSEHGLPRDWRGLAHLSNLGGEIMPLLTTHSDPSARILTILEEKSKNVSIKNFQVMLQTIGRWDVLDDTEELFENDAQMYLEQVKKSEISADTIENNTDAQILTVDDLHRLRQGLESQYYDAFLLYADEDVKFAEEIIENLENKFNLKLCLKDRDLIGGVTFEHEAVMTLISERCNRLVVIISSNFLKSPENKFFLNYAQALGIDKRQRKIIPCLYEKCQLPPQLCYMFILDYNRIGLYDFWGRLRDSIKVATVTKDSSQQMIEDRANQHKIENGQHVHCIENSKNVCLEKIQYPKSFHTNAKSSDMFINSICSIPDNLNSLKNVQKSSDMIQNDLTDLKYLNQKSKKSINILQWTKSKWNRKPENIEQTYQPISETITIDSLPSPESLETLNITASPVDKKQKKKIANKYFKKIQIKKVLLKS